MTEAHSPENGGAFAAPENVGTKRHRRPSVRLGEIGGDQISYDHNHQRRPKMLWNKDSSNKGSSKTLARHCTNFASNETLTLVDNNGNDNFSNGRKKKSDGSNLDVEDRGGNLESVAIGSWKIRDLKSKRSVTTKRVRSNLASKVNVSEGDDKILSSNCDDFENNDRIDREFEPDNSEHSPVHSYDNNNMNMDRRIGNLDGGRRGTRVSEEGPSDAEHRNWNCSSERNGVRVWLDQLGLGRYAPVFEIHEVDDEVLPMLTLEDLKDMGISAVGSRRKMYCSIQKLNKGFS